MASPDTFLRFFDGDGRGGAAISPPPPVNPALLYLAHGNEQTILCCRLGAYACFAVSDFVD